MGLSLFPHLFDSLLVMNLGAQKQQNRQCAWTIYLYHIIAHFKPDTKISQSINIDLNFIRSTISYLEINSIEQNLTLLNQISFHPICLKMEGLLDPFPTC